MAYKKQTFISHSSGGWKSKIKAPTDLVSGESSPPGSRTFSPCRHMTGGKGAFLGFLDKGTDSIYKALSSQPNHFPKAPPLNNPHIGY